MTERKNTTSLTLLYDNIRWEEKAIYESARKRGIDITNVDCKDLILELDGPSYSNKIIIQRCVSYFKSLHSTAALEGLGASVINPLNTSIVCGNKLFTHMKLKNAGIKTPKVITTFSYEAALSALDVFGYPTIIKPTIGSWGRLIALLKDKDAAKAVIEDRQHMFFDFNYSKQVWSFFTNRLRLVPPVLFEDGLRWLKNPSREKNVKLIVRLLHQACIYLIWKERNSSIHTNIARPPEAIIAEVKQIIQLRLDPLARAQTLGHGEISVLAS